MRIHPALIAMVFLATVPPPVRAQDKPAAAAPRAPRLLYVVDAESEEPIADAEVRDLISRNSMKTSKDGVVGLFVPSFVKRDGALIEVRKAGYESSARFFVDPTSDTTLVIALFKVNSGRARVIVRKRADSTIFQIAVLDETGAPMADANIGIVRGTSTALASRVTDTTGARLLSVPEVTGDVQVTVQKVGYAPYRQFYRLNIADTVEAQVAMLRLAQQLEAVTVVAKGNIKRRLYHLDANEIANSNRVLIDALDVVRKLRPAMFGDRTRGLEGCGVANVIYVNGRRIVWPPQSVDLKRLPVQRPTPRGTRGPPTTGGATPRMMRLPAPAGEAAATELVRGVLSAIKPEHVAEMTYLDCFDTSVPGLHRNNAIYVVLKLGIEYDDRRGSLFVRDSTQK